MTVFWDVAFNVVWKKFTVVSEEFTSFVIMALSVINNRTSVGNSVAFLHKKILLQMSAHCEPRFSFVAFDVYTVY
jgi:hypothetical protein